ncbi:MAG TPA: 23S rRNA (pseudouridine(1915)-N(3))-methyltransferase RlmH [Thermodesulfovibrionales bacterium]|nr:23S rRNA (pseudouridine(1915)-N(3))-methyltransferase RlmH [Thermodesulfovibrionales bacterium]
MKIHLVWVGKTKERFILEGLHKYLKLLRFYADIDITEIREEKVKDIGRMLSREGERIRGLGTGYVLLDEKGEDFDSPSFARFVEKQGSSVTFLLGGAYGVAEEVKARAKKTIALSSLTFTHEMSRLIFLEQLYRAFTILQKKGYHH